MGDRKFTLIELNLVGDAQFSGGGLADAIPGIGAAGEESEAPEEDLDELEEEEESGGRSPVAAIVGLVLLVGTAVALKKFRGSEDEEDELEPREEPDVIVN